MIIRELINLIGFKTDEKSLKDTEKKALALGKNLQRVGTKLSIGITAPLTALAVASLSAFNKQAQALAQVETGLKATGHAAGKSMEELSKLATDLQNETLFGDEEILAGATAQLLTFTNIAGKNFDRTQQAILDVATRLAATTGGAADLTSTSIMLGKALNDPVANLGALSRSGIQFTKTQKDVIKSLVEVGKTADAQTLILNELEKQYGGSAAAVAKAGTGGLKQLLNLLGDLSEQIGEIIWEFLAPFIIRLKSVVKGFIGLNKGTKKIIIIFGAFAALIGPLLLLVGTLTIAFTNLSIAISANPIGLIVLAVAAAIAALVLLWFNLDRIINLFKKFWTEGGKIKKTLLLIAAWIFLPITAIILLMKTIKKLIANFDQIKAVVIGTFKGIGIIIGLVRDKIIGIKNTILQILIPAFLFIGSIVMKIKDSVLWAFNKIIDIVLNVKEKLLSVKDSVIGFFDPVVEGFKKVWEIMGKIAGFIGNIFQPIVDSIKNKIISVLNFIIDKYNLVAGIIGKEIDKIANVSAELTADQAVKDNLSEAEKRQQNNININNQTNFNGETPQNPAEIKRAVAQAAGSVFNLQLKKLLIDAGGF